MSSILLTGGLGYIGCRLAPLLIERGHRVRIVDRGFFLEEKSPSLLEAAGAEWIRADVRWIDESAFDGIDAVIDLAGLSNDPSCELDKTLTEEINLGGCRRVAELAKKCGARRFLQSSSCSVYGAGNEAVLLEESQTRPVSAYARSKLDAERGLLALAGDGFEPVILRNATVYGLSPRMRFDLVINLMTLYAFRDRKVFVMGGGAQWRPLIHIDDLCRAFLLALEADSDAVAGETFNVGSDAQNYRIFQLAQMVKGVAPEIELVTAPDDPDRRSYRVGFEKIRSRLGFTPRKTPRHGILEILDALRSGVVQDSLRAHTVDFYRYLIDAKRALDEVSLDGRLF